MKRLLAIYLKPAVLFGAVVLFRNCLVFTIDELNFGNSFSSHCMRSIPTRYTVRFGICADRTQCETQYFWLCVCFFFGSTFYGRMLWSVQVLCTRDVRMRNGVVRVVDVAINNCSNFCFSSHLCLAIRISSPPAWCVGCLFFARNDAVIISVEKSFFSTIDINKISIVAVNICAECFYHKPSNIHGTTT